MLKVWSRVYSRHFLLCPACRVCTDARHRTVASTEVTRLWNTNIQGLVPESSCDVLGRRGPALGSWGTALGSCGTALGSWGTALGSCGTALGSWGTALGSCGSALGKFAVAFGSRLLTLCGDFLSSAYTDIPCRETKAIISPVATCLRIWLCLTTGTSSRFIKCKYRI